MARRKPGPGAQILEEASSWFIDFSEGAGDATAREEFNFWLRRSPEHVRAYLQISAFWENAGALGKRTDADLQAMISLAQAEQNVFPLEVARPRPGKTVTSPDRRRSFALAASLLVAIGLGAAAWYMQRTPTYRAEIGEQRSMMLADGSSMTLNSRSRVRVDFTDQSRRVVLLEGQALFKVATDAARPFVVTTGGTEIRALGTEFDVYRKRQGTVVTVIEGRVAVRTEAPVRERPVANAGGASGRSKQPRGAVLVSAGQQVEVTPASVPAATSANLAVATAWTEKRLIFQDTPLRSVVEEFNRYNRRQLVIQDAALYEFHLSGVFPSTDPERMLELLRQRFAVTIHRTEDEIEISRAPTPAPTDL